MFGNNGLQIPWGGQGLLSVKLARSFCVLMGSLQLFQLPPTAQKKTQRQNTRQKYLFGG